MKKIALILTFIAGIIIGGIIVSNYIINNVKELKVEKSDGGELIHYELMRARIWILYRL